MFRFFEMLPGLFSWGTLIGLVVLSWQIPSFVVIFIVLYDLYWLLRSIYLFFHLRVSFKKLRENEKIDWFERVKKIDGWEQIYHLVILPMRREPHELVRETFTQLLKTNYPKEKLLVVLGTEEREGEKDAETARHIEEEFSKSFKSFLITKHPAKIEGEIVGKGANETWATKEAVARLVDPSGIPRENVIATVFDVDTRAGEEYFGILTHKFLTEPNPLRASYQPIPLFINNIHDVPIFARLVALTSTFWQFMQQARPEQLVSFSSNSIPLSPLIEIGYWNKDIVSEDSRIFFQCFLHYKGNWRVVPLLYPVYMDAVAGKNTLDALKNLYKQQRRWAWGIENVPYLLHAFIKENVIPLRKKIFWSFSLLEGFYSWATSSFVIFLFGFLPNVIGGSAFTSTLASYNLPRITGILVNLSIIGIITSAFLSVALIVPRLKFNEFKFYYYFLYLLQWFLMPLTFLFFSGPPALEAQTRMLLGGKFRLGFWVTPKKLARDQKRT